MSALPDDALVVRGGLNEPDSFSKGTGVTTDADGLLSEVSVQCAPGKTEKELARPLLNGQIGVTTLGQLRAAGGEVDPAPTPSNPNHCLLRGLDAAASSSLFTPTILNPHRVK